MERALLSPGDAEFVYRPTALAEPFSRGRARRQRSTRSGRVVICGSQVEDRSRLAVTNAREGLSYDALVIPSALEAIDAIGPRSRPHVLVPGCGREPPP